MSLPTLYAFISKGEGKKAKRLTDSVQDLYRREMALTERLREHNIEFPAHVKDLRTDDPITWYGDHLSLWVHEFMPSALLRMSERHPEATFLMTLYKKRDREGGVSMDSFKGIVAKAGRVEQGECVCIYSRCDLDEKSLGVAFKSKEFGRFTVLTDIRIW